MLIEQYHRISAHARPALVSALTLSRCQQTSSDDTDHEDARRIRHLLPLLGNDWVLTGLTTGMSDVLGEDSQTVRQTLLEVADTTDPVLAARILADRLKLSEKANRLLSPN